MAWYEKQVEWGEEHDYRTIDISFPALQNWFMEMEETFPPMDGESAPGPDLLDEDENLEYHPADYCTRRDVIYVAFCMVSGR